MIGVRSLSRSIAPLCYSHGENFLSYSSIHDSSFGIVSKLLDGLLENGVWFQSATDSLVSISIPTELSPEGCGCRGETVYAGPRFLWNKKSKPLACTCHAVINCYTVLKNWRIVLKKATFSISFGLQESYYFPLGKHRFSCVHRNCDRKNDPTSYFFAKFLPFLTISWRRKEKRNFRPGEVLQFQNNDPLKTKVITELPYRLMWFFLDKACWLVSLTLILLTWKIRWAPNIAIKWQMGFNLAFKMLIFKLLLSFLLFLLYFHILCSFFTIYFILKSIYSNVMCAYLIFSVTSAIHQGTFLYQLACCLSRSKN
jgi:hypothetical protein